MNSITTPLNLVQIRNVEKVRGFLYILYSHVIKLTKYYHQNDEKEIGDSAYSWLTEQFAELDAMLEDVETFFLGLMKTQEIESLLDKIKANYESEKKQHCVLS